MNYLPTEAAGVAAARNEGYGVLVLVTFGQPDSYTGSASETVTPFRGRLTALDKGGITESETGMRDSRQAFRCVGAVSGVTVGAEVRHTASGRAWSVVALESPPTGGFGSSSFIVEEIG